MLYELKSNGQYNKISKTNLASIKWKEKDLENMMKQNLNDFISERSLMPIFTERQYQEEPDILAIDKEGNLYIFELKRWQSNTENLLQVLRYGQLYGNNNYQELNEMYKKYTNRNNELKKSHKDYFGISKCLEEKEYNKKQNFIVVTNGMDQKTIEAIEYWKSQGLNIDGLIYWIYKIGDKNYIEIDKYLPDKDMLDYETNNYILNTNYNNDPRSHEEMLEREIAAAYVSGWKEKIDKLQEGDKVFLYKSGTGIVALGLVAGKRKSENWNGVENDKYYVSLKKFKNIKSNPINIDTMKKIRGYGYPFRTTMYSIDDETSKELEKEINRRYK